MRNSIKTKNSLGKTMLSLVIGVVLMLTSATLLQGCKSEHKKAEEKILTHLEEKYPGEKFKVIDLKGPGLPGTIGHWTAYCSPRSHEDVVFEITMGRNGESLIDDTYPADAANTHLKTIVDDAFSKQGINAGAFLDINQNPTTDPPEVLFDVREFLQEFPLSRVRGFVFIDRSSITEAGFGEALEAASREIYSKIDHDFLMFIYVVDVGKDSFDKSMDMQKKYPISDMGSLYSRLDSVCVFSYLFENNEGDLSADTINTYLKEGYIDGRF